MFSQVLLLLHIHHWRYSLLLFVSGCFSMSLTLQLSFWDPWKPSLALISNLTAFVAFLSCLLFFCFPASVLIMGPHWLPDVCCCCCNASATDLREHFFHQLCFTLNSFPTFGACTTTTCFYQGFPGSQQFNLEDRRTLYCVVENLVRVQLSVLITQQPTNWMPSNELCLNLLNLFD